ncbi:MAG: hypothetical protein LBJ86_07815 [Spirochaetaceae bacterium]|jgi:hypothetical protein|nr:hypothetical protein [Spirochaetaceae bacterium]
MVKNKIKHLAETYKTVSENKIKHLEFIQDVITRMNTNSFQIKCMSITITAAVLALYASSGNPLYFFVAVITDIFFWFLDAYYLQQERKFRGIYNDVAELTSEENRIHVQEFEMPLQKYKYEKNKGKKHPSKKYSYWNVFRSKTIWPVYLILIAALLVGGILLSKGIVEININIPARGVPK